jgi:hypothetical protein
MMVKRLKVLPNHTPRLAGAAKPGAGLAFVTAATAESTQNSENYSGHAS